MYDRELTIRPGWKQQLMLIPKNRGSASRHGGAEYVHRRAQLQQGDIQYNWYVYQCIKKIDNYIHDYMHLFVHVFAHNHVYIYMSYIYV